ncbi:MAG: Npt1/Npt2 family nucleotide transporter [Pseudomonadota bacterium]
MPSGVLVRLLAGGFSLMVSYGMIRPLSNSLYSDLVGPENMFWAMALVPAVVTLVMIPYARLLSAQGPRRTLSITTIASAALLLAPVLIRGRDGAFGLYLWREAYIVLLVEQFWAFANSSVDTRTGKRLYGLLLIVGGLGAMAGNGLVSWLAEAAGSWALVAASTSSLVPFLLLMDAAHRRTPVGAEHRGPGGASTSHGHLGLGLFRSHRKLVFLAVIIALGQLFSATMDVTFHVHLKEAFPDVDLRAAREAAFWAAVNGGSMLLNLVAPAVLAVLSLRRLHLLYPLGHLALAVTAILVPGFWTAAVALAWFKIVDYSLFRSSKELLYIPLPFDARYRTKMLIDMVIYRMSKGGGALVLAALGAATAGGGLGLPLIAACCAAGWAGCAPGLTDADAAQ